MFAGRESELQELTAFAREALAGKAGVLFISGEAGMGKTTLVEELLRRLTIEYPTLVTLSKKCTVEGASYLPFRGILEELVERRGEVNVSGEIGRKSDKVKDTVLSVIKDVGTDVLSIFLPQAVAGITGKGMLSVFDQLFSKRQKDLGGLVVPKELEMSQVFGWYTRVMKNIADKFPLALFIDDLHWADTSSLEMLKHLGLDLKESRILVIGTYRPHDVAPNGLLIQVTTRLSQHGAKIFPLDVSQEHPSTQHRAAQFVRDYLQRCYQTNFSDRFERLLIDRTEGNALFLTELLKNMEEKGEIQPHPQPLSERKGGINTPPLRGGEGGGVTWRLTAQICGLADLPERVEQTIKERVDRVTQFSKTLAEILECASVEGDEFIAQVIAKVKERDDMQVLEELTAQLMTAHQLIYERGGTSLANGSRIHEFAFKHNLIREYVYQHLPKTKRELLHVKIGECLETLYAANADDIAAQFAVHFYHGYVPEKAISYGLKAAQDANARYGAAEAARFAKMGLEALETRKTALPPNEYAETKVQLLLELAKAERAGGDPGELKDHIQTGISYLENHVTLLKDVADRITGEFYSQLGILYSKKSGNAIKTKECLERALSIYESIGNKRQMAEMLYRLGLVYLNIPTTEGELTPDEKRFESLKKSLSIAESIQDIELQSKVLSILANCYRGKKDFLCAEKCALRALELSTGDKYAEIEACISVAGMNRGYAKYQSAIHYLKRALQLARQIGDTFQESAILNDLGADYRRYIHLQNEALNFLKKSISIKDQIGTGKIASLFLVGHLFKTIGQWEESEKYYREIIQNTDQRNQAIAMFAIGGLRMLQEKYAEAEPLFLSMLEMRTIFRKEKDAGESLIISLNYGLLGKVKECKQYLRIAQNLFHEENKQVEKAHYWSHLADVYQILNEPELAKTACQQSLDWFFTNAEDPENLYYVAEANLKMGKILVDMEEYQEALVYLDKAKAAFEICQHYALGETLLYLGKAYVGLGGVILRRQGKDYVMQALAEFERLELQHKASEARELLKGLP